MNKSISNICRCCMNNSKEMKSIFSEEEITGTRKLISEMLMACASVNVSNEDGLPLNLCLCCITELNNAFIFKQRCEEIDATLRERVIKCDKSYTETEYVEEIIIEPEDNKSIQTADGSESDKIYTSKSKQILEKTEINEKIINNDSENELYEILEEFCDEQLENNGTVNEETGLSNFKCKYCTKIFIKSKQLSKHLSNVHSINDTTCSYCYKEFITKTSLRQHLKIHTKIYPCNLCKKIFKSSHGLWYHMKRHYDIKEYECPISLCKKKFTVKQALRKHFETFHTHEKKYLCPECGKAYSTHDALSYHLKQHRGQRPFLCIHCGKTFKQSCHLKTHMWIHNGIKPYKCNHCGNCYTTGHQLKRHNVIHSKKSFKLDKPQETKKKLTS